MKHMAVTSSNKHDRRRASAWLCPGLVLAVLLTACEGDSPGLGEERISANEAEITDKMIDAIKVITIQRHPDGQRLRFNQSKGLGCFDAAFEVSKEIPASLRHGVFSRPQTYPARVRFANATEVDDREKDFRGMSIKLSGVGDETLWGAPGEQDFLLNSYPALFAADPEDFLDFIEATRDDNLISYFIRPGHFYSLKIIFQGREKIENPFAIRYWSTTPYRLGADQTRAVKYSVKPCDSEPFTLGSKKGKNFLTQAMKSQLETGQACFDFMVQVQNDAAAMPIEDASVVWDESESPFVKVATLTIENQPFTAPENVQACEAMSFNPWQSLADHKPLGGINRVRKPVYSEISAFRRER